MDINLVNLNRNKYYIECYVSCLILNIYCWYANANNLFMFVLRDKIKRVLRTKADKKSERQKLIDGFNPEKYKKYNWKEKYNPWWITVFDKRRKKYWKKNNICLFPYFLRMQKKELVFYLLFSLIWDIT